MRRHITLFLQAEAAVQAEAIELSASVENRNTGTDVALNRTVSAASEHEDVASHFSAF